MALLHADLHKPGFYNTCLCCAKLHMPAHNPTTTIDCCCLTPFSSPPHTHPLSWFFGCWQQYGVGEGWIGWAPINRKARRENETYLVPQDFPCYYKCCNFPFSQLLFMRSLGWNELVGKKVDTPAYLEIDGLVSRNHWHSSVSGAALSSVFNLLVRLQVKTHQELHYKPLVGRTHMGCKEACSTQAAALAFQETNVFYDEKPRRICVKDRGLSRDVVHGYKYKRNH